MLRAEYEVRDRARATSKVDAGARLSFISRVREAVRDQGRSNASGSATVTDAFRFCCA